MRNSKRRTRVKDARKELYDRKRQQAGHMGRVKDDREKARVLQWQESDVSRK